MWLLEGLHNSPVIFQACLLLNWSMALKLLTGDRKVKLVYKKNKITAKQMHVKLVFIQLFAPL